MQTRMATTVKDIADSRAEDEDVDALLDYWGLGKSGVDPDEFADWQVDESSPIAQAAEPSDKRVAKTDSDEFLAAGGGVLIPRPALLTRILLLLMVLLLGSLAVGGALVAEAVSELVGDLRHGQGGPGAEVVAEPVPPMELLLDDAAFGDHLGKRPRQRPQLLLVRAEALRQAGRTEAAAQAYRQARLESLTELGLEERVAYAGVLAELRRYDEARELLRSVQLAELDEAAKARVLELVGRLHLAD